jgi:RNA polymerase sigma factor (sigma-70 family)
MVKNVKSACGISQFEVRQTKMEMLILTTLLAFGSTVELIDLILRGSIRMILKRTWKSDDAAGNSLSYLWEVLTSYSPDKGEFSTFVSQACRAGKQMARRKEHSSEFLFSDVDVQNDDGKSVEDTLTERNRVSCVDVSEQIDNLAACVSPEDMEILSLVCFEGLTFQELGDRLGLTKQGARLKVLRTINKIRKQYGIEDQVTGLSRFGVKMEGGFETPKTRYQDLPCEYQVSRDGRVLKTFSTAEEANAYARNSRMCLDVDKVVCI